MRSELAITQMLKLIYGTTISQVTEHKLRSSYKSISLNYAVTSIIFPYTKGPVGH